MAILSSLFGVTAVRKIAMETRWAIGFYPSHNFTFDVVSHQAGYSGAASSYLDSYIVNYDIGKAKSSK